MNCAMNVLIDLIVTGLATLTGILFGFGVGVLWERRRADGVDLPDGDQR